MVTAHQQLMRHDDAFDDLMVKLPAVILADAKCEIFGVEVPVQLGFIF